MGFTRRQELKYQDAEGGPVVSGLCRHGELLI